MIEVSADDFFFPEEGRKFRVSFPLDGETRTLEFEMPKTEMHFPACVNWAVWVALKEVRAAGWAMFEAPGLAKPYPYVGDSVWWNEHACAALTAFVAGRVGGGK